MARDYVLLVEDDDSRYLVSDIEVEADNAQSARSRFAQALATDATFGALIGKGAKAQVLTTNTWDPTPLTATDISWLKKRPKKNDQGTSGTGKTESEEATGDGQQGNDGS